MALCPNCGVVNPAGMAFCGKCAAPLNRTNGSASRFTPPPAPADLTGELIGEYRVVRKLGEGGMGAVYLGQHQALGQEVALKVLNPLLARSPELVERFIQEARIQVSLRHPNIVEVLTAVTTGPHLALVMEHIDGNSLDKVLERRGRLPWDEAAKVFEQVLSGVGHAHSRGVIHRDLKPANIMVRADGTAKVMDFGIAKVLSGVKLTQTGTTMGSAYYMSPEQVLGRRDLDQRADIYSLGVTLFETLTGRVPFEGAGGTDSDSDFLVKQAQVQTPPPDPRALCKDIPAHVSTAILRALAKEPDKRFGTCGEVWAALPRPRPPTPKPNANRFNSLVVEEHPPSSLRPPSPKPTADRINGQNGGRSEEKKCPSCGGSILAAAIMCKHCKRMLPVAARGEVPPSPKSAVIVDNDSTAATKLHSLLENHGFEVRVTPDGAKGIDPVRTKMLLAVAGLGALGTVLGAIVIILAMAIALSTRQSPIPLQTDFRPEQGGLEHEEVQYPEWVLRGSGAFGGEAGKAFYGVGSVSGIRNQALARTTADNRARAETAKIFETYVAFLMKDYMASTTAGELSAASQEQHIENAIEVFSAATLSDVQIVDHWFHPDGTVFALAQLDLESFTIALPKMRELALQLRNYLRKNADRAFADLASGK